LEDGAELQGTRDGHHNTCTVRFIGINGTPLDLSGLIGIESFSFASHLPDLTDMMISESYQAILAELKFDGPDGSYSKEAFVFSDCNLGFFDEVEVPCPDVSKELCKPTVLVSLKDSLDMRNNLETVRPSILKRERSLSEADRSGWLSRDSRIAIAGSEKETSCEILKEPSGCTKIALDKIENYIEGDQSLTLEARECFESLRFERDHIWLGGEDKRMDCAYMFYTANGNIVLLSRLSEVIGDPIHDVALPDTFDSSQVQNRMNYTMLKFKAQLVSPVESVWIYIFSSCKLELQDLCRDVPVTLNFNIPPPFDIGDRCEDEVSRAAERAARFEWDEQLETETETVRRRFQDNSFSESFFKENFYYSTKDTEHHHVLYYYGQAANLLQTVPPEGVALLTDAQANQHLAGIDSAPNPTHRMLTGFAYDSLNNLIWSQIPDWKNNGTPCEGKKRFWHNDGTQLRFSQSPQQCSDNTFTYTNYDEQGRIIQVGLISGITESQIIAHLNSRDFPCDEEFNGNCGSPPYSLSEKTTMLYDSIEDIEQCAQLRPEYLRGRLAAIIRDTSGDEKVTICYSYDARGRIASLLQIIPDLEEPKRVDYKYDVVSGNLTEIHYQTSPEQSEENPIDQFHHRYEYADNRLVAVYTSRDGYTYKKDAAYKYYKHGPLARLELGENRIQGLDYVYTIRGQLKAVNRNTLDIGQTLDVTRDPGRDGQIPPNGSEPFARDVFGYTLGYFQGDYKSIKETQCEIVWTSAGCPWNHFEASTGGSKFIDDAPDFFDGNISHQVIANRSFLEQDKGVLGQAYRYDQLNRLVTAKIHKEINNTDNSWPSDLEPDNSYNMAALDVYNQNIVSGYDANGNILRLERYGEATVSANPSDYKMDELTYKYDIDSNNKLRSNRLLHINESNAIPATRYGNDLDDQGTFDLNNTSTYNYAYDDDGNLKKDTSEGIMDIEYNPYGRVRSLTQSDGDPDLEFLYDGLQNRIAKLVKPSDPNAAAYTNFYVRDSNGNIMATYRRFTDSSTGNEKIELKDFVIQGGIKRLGTLIADMIIYDESITVGVSATGEVPGASDSTVFGNKRYELTNHLGNVLALVTNRKLSADIDNDNTADYFNAELSSSVDYYPFGMEMRRWLNNDDSYHYGFNGYERDDDFKGQGNSYLTAARRYDPRVGRWWSVDPLMNFDSSPYEGFKNNAANFIDPKGEVAFNPQDAYNESYNYSRRQGLSHEESHQIAQEVRDAHAGMHGVVGEFIWDAFGDTLADIVELGRSIWDRNIKSSIISAGAMIVPGVSARGVKKIVGKVTDIAPKSIKRITPGSLPKAEEQAVLDILKHIDEGTKPTGPLKKKWGTQFKNWKKDLPGKRGKSSSYKEYRVEPPPGTSTAGERRIVVNTETGEAYYTWTHYGDTGLPAFVQIR
jgi:RHS repeat-associated protein